MCCFIQNISLGIPGVRKCLDDDLHAVVRANEPKNSFAIISGLLSHFAHFQEFSSKGMGGLFLSQPERVVTQLARGAKVKINSANGFCIRFTPHLLGDVVGALPKSKL